MQRVLRPRAARGGTVASSSHTASSSHAVVISTTSDADSEQDIDSEPESDTEVSDIYVPQVVSDKSDDESKVKGEPEHDEDEHIYQKDENDHEEDVDFEAPHAKRQRVANGKSLNILIEHPNHQ